MKIVVNDRELDVTLQDETTAGEVVDELKEWLAGSGMSIQRFCLDNTDVSDEQRETWAATRVENIGTIEVEAALPAERDPQSLVTLIEYFELLSRNLEQGSEKALRDVLGEFGYLEQSLDRVLRLTGGSDTLDPIRRLSRSLVEENSSVTEEDCAEALKAASNALSALQSRLSEIVRPEKELEITASLLNEQLPAVSETAILLQQGKDEEAMARIARFSDLVAKFTRLKPEAETEGLRSQLSELVEAFEAKDSVLIGDLLEYEIVPAIEDAVANHIYRKGA